MSDSEPTTETDGHSVAPAGAYRVLARKYRPQNFAELIGQEALVRTLKNAIQSGRLHQAYMLTGVRGVGKTTTARIIARALNCVGPDGTGGPTVDPCGVCEPCRSIAADRNVDVMEMDAASRTGVDDIREIVEGVRYAPVAARFKIYVIDEVHMLTKNAFNALLKTLEEPPPHVKFVFATTEIRKVPVTVLSRCQRFDLRRVDAVTLAAHFARVAEAEGVPVSAEALQLLARAADGSVRDGLSLLDQAIALSGGGDVTGQQVRDMLGLADREQVIDLFEATLSGRPAEALEIVQALHRSGAEPVVVVQDLLDFTHFLSRVRAVPGVADDPATPEAERVRGKSLAAKLSMPVLTRTWQILLKGLAEVAQAPVPVQALDMLIIRLAYAADLPTPGDLVRRLQDGAASDAGRAPAGNAAVPAAPVREPALSGPVAAASLTVSAHGAGHATPVAVAPNGRGPGSGATALQEVPVPTPPVPAAPALANPRTFRDVVNLFGDRREGRIAGDLASAVHLVRFEPGMIEFRPTPFASPNLAGRVGQLLTEWTGRRWIASVSGAPGDPTLTEQDRQSDAQAREEAANHPTVRALLDAFPGAKIEAVRDLSAPPEPVPDMGSDFDGDTDGGDAYIDDSMLGMDDDWEGDF